MQPDTRNLALALALETLRVTENRYSGIPTIRKDMEKYHLKEPVFSDARGSFILDFCNKSRTRKEICEYLGSSSVSYAIQTHVMLLVESGQIKLAIPEKPKSPKQLYYS